MLWEFGGRSHSSLVDDFLYSRHLSPFDNVKVTYVEINFWSLGCWRVGQTKSVLPPGVLRRKLTCKLAKWWRHNQILIKYMMKDFSAKLYQKCLILCNKILLSAPQYEHNSFVTLATYWVPDFPNIKGFSGHLCILFLHVLIVPHMHDPPSIKIC